jgi:hypothetical protein
MYSISISSLGAPNIDVNIEFKGYLETGKQEGLEERE